MGNIKLFDVADSFFVKGQGLSLVVDVPVHGIDKYKPIQETISIVLPNNTRQDYQAIFKIMHFSMLGGTGKYSFVVTLPTAKKDSVPAGSQVFGGDSAAAMLFGQQH
jgi:hypothetical protein